MGVLPSNRTGFGTRVPQHSLASGVSRSFLVRKESVAVCSRPIRRLRVRDTRIHALNTNDGTRCSFPASYEKLFRVGFPATFPSYLGDLESRITRFDLPLGANVTTRENGEIVLEVPKVTFLDLFVHPTSTLAISKRGKKDVEISALDTEIHGSHHVESLDCNNRFELLLNVRLAADSDTLHAKATFKLDVDVPFPLNMTPKPAIELTGTAAVEKTLTNLMDTLCASIVRDHVVWTKANQRAEAEQAAVPVA